MKKEFKTVISLIATLTLLSGCNSAEMDALRSENESLRSELSSAQSKIEYYENELATTAETTDDITAETESAAEDKEVSTMTAEEIQSYIAIGGAEVTDINSADGVSVAVYWRNNSDKEIKYITFDLEIINAVGDVVANQIGRTTLFPCRLTGPIGSTQKLIDSAVEGSFELIYYKKENGYWDSIFNPTDGSKGLAYPYEYDPEIKLWTRATIPESDYYKIMEKTEWETIMYNPTAHSVNIVSVNVEYMDGTVIDIDSDSIENAFIDY